MKRFFCTVCKRVVRVITLPDNVRTHYNVETGGQEAGGTIHQRLGTCRYHDSGRSRAQVFDRVRKLKTIKRAGSTELPRGKR